MSSHFLAYFSIESKRIIQLQHPTPQPSTPLTSSNNKTWTTSILPLQIIPREQTLTIPARPHTFSSPNLTTLDNYNHRTAIRCTFKVPNRLVVSHTSGSAKERDMRPPEFSACQSAGLILPSMMTLVIGYEQRSKDRRVCPAPIAFPFLIPTIFGEGTFHHTTIIIVSITKPQNDYPKEKKKPKWSANANIESLSPRMQCLKPDCGVALC